MEGPTFPAYPKSPIDGCFNPGDVAYALTSPQRQRLRHVDPLRWTPPSPTAQWAAPQTPPPTGHRRLHYDPSERDGRIQTTATYYTTSLLSATVEYRPTLTATICLA